MNTDISDERFQQRIEAVILDEKKSIEDIPIVKTNKSSRTRESHRISAEVAKRAIIHVRYLCEVNSNHEYFISNTTKENYVEAHQLISLEYQEDFKYSLDVEANIVSLCVLCQRMVHYGTFEDEYLVIESLYKKRKDRLTKCEIGITLKKQLELYR